MVSRFTRIYETQIKKTNNILNKNIDTNIKQYKTHKKKKKNNYFCGCLGQSTTDGR